MKIIESILTNNPCYTEGRKITVKGLMLHSVGCPQPSASVFVKNWNKASYDRACVHGFIDANSGDVYQCLPWNHRGWHAGKGSNGSANNTHIGVEMCEPNCIKYTSGSSFTCSDVAKAQEMVQATYNSAVELFAKLCVEFGLDPMGDGVIISHKEGSARGVASNHGDPEHLWNQLGMGYTMDTFRNAVKAFMTADSATGTNTPATENNATEASKSYPNTPFLVNVIISGLNYRTAPSMSGTVKGQTGKGTFTITEVSGDWGKLKSGAGWIYLANPSYCTIKGTTTTAPAQTTTQTAKKSVDEIAKEVIQGKWGNGADRKKRLTEAGYNYSEVQKKVNALLLKK